MALMGGFARIGNNEITILVNDAERGSDIDSQEAQQTLEIAEANLRKAEGKRQVVKWMLCKGQGTTMATYDTVLLAFDMEERIDEAGSLWNMILHTHTRSISKRLFSRMISLYDHHDIPEKVIEVLADMEELGVKPDEDTVRRVARTFERLGQEDKKNLVIKRYGCKWKYIHFKGERVKVRRDLLVDS
uniref:Pentatricopeptide repeat-containing protein n=1 Tax=Chenopodium quinoa TaxID=63459 RepID=A0A803MVA5_CHEQI